MILLQRIHRAALVCAALVTIGVGSSNAQTTDLTPLQILNASVAALHNNQSSIALELTRALLERNPDDIPALLVHARAARTTGNYALSQHSAKRAWKLSRNPETKHAAARLTAQALSSQGKRTRAQLWLRRAVQYAPDNSARSITIQDFNYVRSRNPWSTHLRFSVTPNSNINNGSANSTSLVSGLPFEFTLNGAARALSGIETSGGITTRYRFSHSRDHATDITFNLDHKTYIMSEAAKIQAPANQGRDFALTTIGLSVAQRWTNPKSSIETTFTTTANANWYGGSTYGYTYRISLGQTIPTSRRARFDWSLSADRTLGPRAPHATAIRAGVGITRSLQNGAILRFTLRASQSQSSVNSADFTDFSTGMSYQPAKTLLGAKATFGFNLRIRDFPVSLVPAGRQDREASAYFQMRFVKFDYYGFSPTATVTASRTLSNIGLFEIDQFGVSIGFQSAF